MAFTPFSADNAEFTRHAHCAARSLVYPSLFRTAESNIKFEDVDANNTQRSRILDGEFGIDKIVRITHKDFGAPISFTVQERFRKPHFAKWRDVLITEWNHNSNLPSELYKLYAHLFVYGYFDPGPKTFIEVVAVDVVTVLHKLITQELRYSRDAPNPRTNQATMVIKMDDLLSCGAVIFHQRAGSEQSGRPLFQVSEKSFDDVDPISLYDEEDEEPRISGGLFDNDYRAIRNH